MANHEMHVELVEVKAQDIIRERRAMYDEFIKASTWGIGAVAAILVLLYLFLG